jgi:universal stress protein A
MKLNRILCPVDFSEHSQSALEMSATLARESGAELILLHSVDSPAAYTGDTYYDLREALKPEAQRDLDRLVVPEPAPPVRRMLVEGDAGAAILDVARDEKVDMIVLSTHGRSGVTRLLMGSVAEYVVRHASCPVLTLKTASAVPATA